MACSLSVRMLSAAEHCRANRDGYLLLVADWATPCAVPRVLLAGASAGAVLDCVLVLVLPGLATETGALAMAAAP